VTVMILTDHASSGRGCAEQRAAGARLPLRLANFLGGVTLAVALAACLLGGANRAYTTRRELGPTAAENAAGARSVAPTVGQITSWYTRYTLNLELDMGGEQSVVVMAPPGGLELAVRDMTGDKVQNDVVVTPALLHWPLTVLVNDGHNHFTVAISAKSPDSSASDQGQASRTRGFVDISALVSAGFEPHALTDRGELPLRPRQSRLLSSIITAATPLHAIASDSGRAPPSLATSI
jgi:hypothetical protein